ncbi:MAG TPA: hypothetical protein VIY28_02160 [Pseudonocardiaceae bacterium]
MITGGSTGATVTGNTTTGGHPTVEIDDSSRPGFYAEANSPNLTSRPPPWSHPGAWSLALGAGWASQAARTSESSG